MAKYFSSVNNLIHIKENSTNKFITVGNNRENSILNLDDDNINANFRVIDNIFFSSSCSNHSIIVLLDKFK